MNINVSIDCTPEEARRVMGLPDLTVIHDIYLERFRRALDEGVTPDMVETMMKSWMPLGDAGMSAWRQLFDRMTTPPPSS